MSGKVVLRLLAADLSYPKELQIHTAASGPVASLSARYLMIEGEDGVRGCGEVRANITYLSKLPESEVDPAIVGLCRALPWRAPAEEILAAVQADATGAPAVAKALLENALHDAAARAKGVPLAVLLGGTWRAAIETNQCLFWGPDEVYDRLAARFLLEGFRQIKVRIAVGPFESDLSRLERLRERAGSSVSIAVDANGAWTTDQAVERLRALERFDLAYVEQPTRPGDWDALRKALKSTSIPLMLDEGLTNEGDIDRLAAIGAPALAHLKIVKLGGPSAVVRAMKRLAEAGVDVMIGQMNEGAMATAIAAHCAMALQPRYAELYGCYGLIDDPTAGVTYAEGKISVRQGPGIGVSFDAARCRTVWEHRLE